MATTGVEQKLDRTAREIRGKFLKLEARIDAIERNQGHITDAVTYQGTLLQAFGEMSAEGFLFPKTPTKKTPTKKTPTRKAPQRKKA